MAECFLSGYSGERVFVEHAGQEMVGLVVDLAVVLVVQIKVAGSILVQNLVVSSAWENGSSHEEDVEDQSR